MSDLSVKEVVDADSLSDDFVSMGLKARLLHNREENRDRDTPNQHAVVFGGTAIIVEAE